MERGLSKRFSTAELEPYRRDAEEEMLCGSGNRSSCLLRSILPRRLRWDVRGACTGATLETFRPGTPPRSVLTCSEFNSVILCRDSLHLVQLSEHFRELLVVRGGGDGGLHELTRLAVALLVGEEFHVTEHGGGIARTEAADE